MWIIQKMFLSLWISKAQNFIPYNWNYDIWTLFNTKKELTETQLINLYKGWIFTACDPIWDWLAWLPRVLYKDDTKQELITHEYLKLFKFNDIKAIAIFLKTIWAIYIYKEKLWTRVDSLLFLNPLNVSVKRDEFWRVLKFWYHTSKGFFTFEKDEIIEIKTFSLLFADKWSTPLKAVAAQIATDLASVEYNKMFFENGWKPGTIIKHQKEIDKNVRKKYIEEFKREFMGLENQHKVMFADNWIEVQTFSTSNKEMEWVSQRTFTMDEVLMAFRVPKPILWKSDWVWFADKRVPGFYMNEYTLKPLATQVIEALNVQLFDWIWYFDFQFPSDRDELMKEYWNNLITRNQYLVATWREETKNWNTYWDWTEAEFFEWKAVNEWILEKAIAKTLETSLTKKKDELIFWTEAYNQKLWDSKIVRTDKYETSFEAIQKKIWKTQEDEIVKQIEWKKSIKALKKDDLIPEKKSILQYLALYTSFYKEFMWKEWTIAIWEISNEVFEIARLNKWIWERIEKMSRDIDETTRNHIFDIIKQWNRDWIWNAQIVANINKQFSLYTKKKWRVSTISRTEITRASNKSQQEAFIQSKVVEQKQWWTANDERRCPYCWDLHWKKIKVNESFLKLWTTHLWQKIDYETIEFPPRHPDCRCVARPIISLKALKETKEIMLKKWITLIINE